MSKLFSTMFKKNNSILKKLLKETKTSILADDTFKVYYPERYSDVNLSHIGSEVTVLGCLIVVDEKNNYALINRSSMFTMEPSTIDTVTIDDVAYICLSFHKGNVFMLDRNVIMDEGLPFMVFNDFVIKGNVPWYLKYEDLLKIFSTSSIYAGYKLMNNALPVECLVSIMGRDTKDVTKYIRQVATTKKDMENVRFISLSNVYEGFTNTVSKLTGSYLRKGMTSAMVNPEKKATDIEKILLT